MAILQDVELRGGKTKVLYGVLMTFLTIGLLVQFFPMFMMVTGSFKTNLELSGVIPTLFPKTWNFGNYIEAFETYDIWKNIGNTVYICAMIMIIQITNSIFAAYSLSQLRPKCGQFIQLIFLGTMMFSGTALLFPLYIMISQMGLIGSKWALILSSSAWAYSIFLFKSFFDGIPRDLMEAANIDGAGKIKCLTSIILPLSKPIIAVNILNTFMAVYNDFLYPLMLLPNDKDWTLMIRVYMLDKIGTEPRIMYVLLTVTTIPMLLVYLVAQKQIVEGVSTTGIKG